MYFPTTLQCRHCAARTTWPRWAKIDIGRYEPLCWICFDLIDDSFTPEAAIRQACGIVYFHHAVLDGRVVCDGGVL